MSNGPSAQELVDDVGGALATTTAEVAEWFVSQMPAAYFHDIDPAMRRQHLAALVGARATGLPPSFTLRGEGGLTWTVIRPEDRPGLLAEVLAEIPTDHTLHAARVYTARDAGLVLDVFRFGEPDRVDPDDPTMRRKRDDTRAWAVEQASDVDLDAMDRWLGGCSRVFLENLSPRRLVRFAALHQRVAGTDGVAVDAWSRSGEDGRTTLTLAAGDARPRRLFERAATLLGHHRLTVVRAYLDPTVEEDGRTVAVCSFVVEGAEAPFAPHGPEWEALRRDLLRVRWLDPRALACAYGRAGLGLDEAEVIVALLDLVHVRLARRDPYRYSRERLAQLAGAGIDVAAALARDFVSSGTEGRDALRDARLPERVREVLEELARAIDATRGSNIHREGRQGLMLDLEPAFLLGPDHEATPFGVLYGHGDGYRGFHVRFREIARGGLRAVAPRAIDQHTIETERLFDEAYGLAFAQQLKNKDIPEGGAKGVVLVHPDAGVAGSVRAFTDGLLDIATAEPPQLLYLGPDENITPELIEWIAARAAERGYPQALAFMSSKPGAGINHKRYGVTSEGVNVFLDVALRAHGIDPTAQPFSVKLTGGPDGDVAGNMIRILRRDYGTHPRILGVADGSGSAEDPDGLDLDELLRLVDDEAPIAAFDPARLGPRGRVLSLEDPGGLEARNTLHFRVAADVFVPAGGRPRTIHEGNWRAFLRDDGRPSSPIIVEGANLFLTPGAREALSKQGVSIVKDSSANKCGVITSSFEIAACMVLDEAAFLEVKDAFVDEVLATLRRMARAEAELLFRARRRWPELSLPDLSVRLSRVILRTTDAIARAMIGMDPDAYTMLEDLVRAHLPDVLLERAGPRILDVLPAAYVEQTIAAAAATRIVYREGLDFLEGMADADVAALAVRYLEEDRAVRRIADALTKLDEPAARRAAELLRHGGARAALALDD